ncbi:MAG TPA: hypothetical protein VF910_01090 [Candidatus Bathyarchaeia archaeon]
MRSMSTPITSLKAPALADLRNALQLAVTYGDKDIADSDAKQALDRIRGLIAQALAKLGEPNAAAVKMVKDLLHSAMGDRAFELIADQDRTARDSAALIICAAMTGETGNGWMERLSCPVCDGVGRIGSIPCDSCKGAGKL